jgi:hypothetical protein
MSNKCANPHCSVSWSYDRSEKYCDYKCKKIAELQTELNTVKGSYNTKCEATVNSKHDPLGDYSQCWRPTKFLIPKEHALGRRNAVCGIHAKAYDRWAKKRGHPPSVAIKAN